MSPWLTDSFRLGNWMGKEKRLGSFAPWASLVVQSVKNLPAVQETWV